MNAILKIKDFCILTGPGLAKEGPFSGEEFRESVLRPAFNILYETVRLNPESKDKITIEFDGAYGYSFEWLEEVFGGIILYNSYPEAKVFGTHVFLRCSEEPYQVSVVQKIVGESLEAMEAFEKKKLLPRKRNNNKKKKK